MDEDGPVALVTGGTRGIGCAITERLLADGWSVLATYQADRVRAEAALIETRRLADRVAAASPAILYVFDFAENRNVYINDALPRLLGYTPEQLTEAGAADLWALMHPEDLARLPEMGAQVAAAADGEVFEQNFRLRHANGDWCWLTQRVTVLSRQPNGRPRLIVGAALDVTGLRETDAALRASEARYRAVVDSQTEMIRPRHHIRATGGEYRWPAPESVAPPRCTPRCDFLDTGGSHR